MHIPRFIVRMMEVSSLVKSGQRHIVISETGNAEVCTSRLKISWLWGFIPVFSIIFVTEKQLKLQKSIGSILNRMRQSIALATKIWLTKKVEARIKRKMNHSMRSLSDSIAASFKNAFREYLQGLLASNKSAVSPAEAEKLLQDSIDNALTKFRGSLIQSNIRAMISKSFYSAGKDIVAEVANKVMMQDEGEEEEEISSWSILPDNCRFYLSSFGTSIVVVECEPQMRTMQFYKDSSTDVVPNSFHLAFPYTIFVCYFEGDRLIDLYVYFRNEPLRSLDDTLYHANFSYINSDGRLHSCGYNQHFATIKENTESAIAYFWQAIYDYYIYNDVNTPLFDGTDESLKNWEKVPLEEITNQDWVESRITLRGTIAELIPENELSHKIHDALTESLRKAEEDIYQSFVNEIGSIKVAGRYSGETTRKIADVLTTIKEEKIGHLLNSVVSTQAPTLQLQDEIFRHLVSSFMESISPKIDALAAEVQLEQDTVRKIVGLMGGKQ